MGRCIDALGKPADNAETRPGEEVGELVGTAGASSRRVATADDRKGRQVHYIDIAKNMKLFGRVLQLCEQFGERRVAEFDRLMLVVHPAIIQAKKTAL